MSVVLSVRAGSRRQREAKEGCDQRFLGHPFIAMVSSVVHSRPDPSGHPLEALQNAELSPTPNTSSSPCSHLAFSLPIRKVETLVAPCTQLAALCSSWLCCCCPFVLNKLPFLPSSLLCHPSKLTPLSPPPGSLASLSRLGHFPSAILAILHSSRRMWPHIATQDNTAWPVPVPQMTGKLPEITAVHGSILHPRA